MNATTTRRGEVGATVRLYGYRGTFTITSLWYGLPTSEMVIWRVRPTDAAFGEFTAPDNSIVEINGYQVALRSLPIAPPASDYPYDQTMVEPSDEERGFALCRTIEADARFKVIR